MPGGCAAGSAQELWLRADLTANSTKNVIAVWHKPRYSSGVTNYQALQPLFDDLYEFGVDILLDGHDHIYERSAPIKSGATLASPPVADPTYGIRAFTVGTGGAALQSCPGTPLSTSQVCNGTTYGVLKLTLHATTYDWVVPADRRQHLHGRRDGQRARRTVGLEHRPGRRRRQLQHDAGHGQGPGRAGCPRPTTAMPTATP